MKIACDIANELPTPPTPSFFLCDCWYSCVKVMDAFMVKGFYTIGALKTNRVIFPVGIRQQCQPRDRWQAFHSALLKERITYIYQCGFAREPLDNLLALVA